MAFICVTFRRLVSQLAGLVEQPIRAEITQCVDKLVSCGVELLPDVFKPGPVYVPDNYAAACSAEDIAERIDVHAFGS